MNKNFNILILGGGKKVSLAKHFKNCEKKNKLKIKVFSYDLDTTSPISMSAKVIKGKLVKDKKIINHIKNIILKHKISLVVSVTDPFTLVLSKLKNLGLDCCKICSDVQTNKILINKSLTNELISKRNFLTTSDKKKFPVIAKLNKGSAASANFLFYDKSSKNKFKKNNKNYIFETFIDGDEYSVDLYINQNKEPEGIVCRKRVEITGGESTVIISEKNKKLENLSLSIAQYFNIIGPANIQFIKKKNKYFFMEINPRIAGGMMNTTKSGLDIPDMMIKETLKKKINKFKFTRVKTVKYFEEYHAYYN